MKNLWIVLLGVVAALCLVGTTAIDKANRDADARVRAAEMRTAYALDDFCSMPIVVGTDAYYDHC